MRRVLSTFQCSIVMPDQKKDIVDISIHFNRMTSVKAFLPLWGRNLIGSRQVWDTYEQLETEVDVLQSTTASRKDLHVNSVSSTTTEYLIVVVFCCLGRVDLSIAVFSKVFIS